MDIPTPALTPLRAAPPVTRADLSRDRILLWIMGIAIAAVCLLISAGGTISEAGSRPWKPTSLLHPVTEVMSLFHVYPTPDGTEVKWLAQGLAAAAILAAVTLLWYGRAKELEDQGFPAGEAPGGIARLRGALTAETSAQIALALFSGWAVLSMLWAPWREAALGEGIRQLLLAAWAIALGRSLSRPAVRRACALFAILLAVTAVLGIWYRIERNPQERLKFPIGNPLFLAACLIPGIMLGVSWLGTVLWEPAKKDTGRSDRRWLLTVAGWSIAVVAMLWAMQLTDSRGPQVALIGGLFVAAYALANPRWRRYLMIAGLVAVFVGAFWFRSQLSVETGGRGATTRLRIYAWQYALTLFLQRPAMGSGQGSYVLQAQGLSRPDAERDPMAFPSEFFGDAHNEWLQILAELGAVGFALMVMTIGVTLWAGMAAIQRRQVMADRWCLAGLMGSLAALVLEECSDVALRMPGLPLLFYTNLGLIWAGTRESGPSTIAPGRALRFLGLVAGLAAAIAATVLSAKDWQGALAQAAIDRQLESHKWEDALRLADTAGSHRMSVRSLVEAEALKVHIASAAATDRVRQLSRMLTRTRQPQPGQDVAQIAALAMEDQRAFDQFFQICLGTAATLWDRIPGYPAICAAAADVILLRRDVDVALSELGARQRQTPDSAYIAAARSWMQQEYQRDRLDAEIALRLLRLSADQPLTERINLLRLPLRRGPVHPGVEPSLAELMRDPAFSSTVNGLLSLAEVAVNAPSAAAWPDPYAPETLRLAAIAQKMTGEFKEAADLAGDAAELYEKIRDRFPSAVSVALGAQAEYVLMARPDQPVLAVNIAEQAVARCPAADRDLTLDLRRDLAMYQVAAGLEDAARETLRSLPGQPLTPDAVERNLGYALTEVCQVFVPFPRAMRPPQFPQWLQRALQLVPQWPPARLIAARLAMEEGQDQVAVEHLRALEPVVTDANQWASLLQPLVANYPNSAALRAYAIERKVPVPDTMPARTADTRPETSPAPAPG